MERLETEMAQAAPVMADQAAGWIESLAGGRPPEAYFTHPMAFPALLLPWWLEESLRPGQVDLAFQADLAYSTINGYYFIRLIDNLMDGQATVEAGLLPALAFFHTQFQSAYQPYFTADHPFWPFFKSAWFGSAEAALKDAQLADIGRGDFLAVAAKKVSAARIPPAAVCYRYRRPELVEPWSEFVDLFGAWHQMLNDLLDWQRDRQAQTRTYFLCEAVRRGCHSDSALAAWVVREGFEWGIDMLGQWMVELRKLGGRLHCPPLLTYLARREAKLQQRREEMAAGLKQLGNILSVISKHT